MRRISHADREEAMQVTVFVERLDEQTYRAETTQPVALATEGRTRDEAIERLRTLAQQRLTAGEMVRLDIPDVAVPHPWVPAERRQLDAAESEA
jgi:hypothetical protein